MNRIWDVGSIYLAQEYGKFGGFVNTNDPSGFLKCGEFLH